MPELTLTVSESDIKLLDSARGEYNLSVRRMAERVLRRGLLLVSKAPRRVNQDRSMDRAQRQLQLVRFLQSRPARAKVERSELQALATQFGVTERTMYRDLDVAVRIMAYEFTDDLAGRVAGDTPDTDDTPDVGFDTLGVKEVDSV